MNNISINIFFSLLLLNSFIQFPQLIQPRINISCYQFPFILSPFYINCTNKRIMNGQPTNSINSHCLMPLSTFSTWDGQYAQFNWAFKLWKFQLHLNENDWQDISLGARVIHFHKHEFYAGCEDTGAKLDEWKYQTKLHTGYSYQNESL